MSDGWAIATSIGTVAAALVALAALWLTLRFQKETQRANRTAQKALTEAQTANSIATQANQISENANTISKRALSVSADQTVYDWRMKFQKDTSTVLVWNESPNKAMNVTVMVRHEDVGLVVEVARDEVAGFEQLALQSDFFRNGIVTNQKARDDFNNSVGVNYLVLPPVVPITVHFSWTSGLGVQRSSKTDYSLS